VGRQGKGLGAVVLLFHSIQGKVIGCGVQGVGQEGGPGGWARRGGPGG
jgi:hypothetical protein